MLSRQLQKLNIFRRSLILPEYIHFLVDALIITVLLKILHNAPIYHFFCFKTKTNDGVTILSNCSERPQFIIPRKKTEILNAYLLHHRAMKEMKTSSYSRINHLPCFIISRERERWNWEYHKRNTTKYLTPLCKIQNDVEEQTGKLCIWIICYRTVCGEYNLIINTWIKFNWKCSSCN